MDEQIKTFLKLNFDDIKIGKIYKHSDDAFNSNFNLFEDKIRYYSTRRGLDCIFVPKNYYFMIIEKIKEKSWIEIAILFESRLYYKDFFFDGIRHRTQIFNLIE